MSGVTTHFIFLFINHRGHGISINVVMLLLVEPTCSLEYVLYTVGSLYILLF